MSSDSAICNLTVAQLIDFGIEPFSNCPGCQKMVAFHANPEASSSLKSTSSAPTAASSEAFSEISIDSVALPVPEISHQLSLKRKDHADQKWVIYFCL
jgi:hypothetical protein